MKKYNHAKIYGILEKHYKKSINKKDIKKYYFSKINFQNISHLYIENTILLLGLNTLRKVLIDKKIATKKEIDDTIDKMAIKLFKEYKK